MVGLSGMQHSPFDFTALLHLLTLDVWTLRRSSQWSPAGDGSGVKLLLDAIGWNVGSKTFDGVWFLSFSDDHPPPHVHGRYGRVQVIIDVFADGTTREAGRWNAVRPANAKRGDVRRILRVAEEHGAESGALRGALWEQTHG
jgi:hypothetical protein